VFSDKLVLPSYRADIIHSGDNGSISFWDWKTGHRFQSVESVAQPGSLDAEAGLMSSVFDQTGLRLICGEADKTSELHLDDTVATTNHSRYSQSVET
jgi:pleiotropic regulator 1